MRVLLGQTLTFDADPFTAGLAAARHERHGAVVIEQGHILAAGPASVILASYGQAPVTNYGQSLISAGFIDAHMHYPQTAIIASWGKRLIDWLNSYTFPEEARFNDPAYAAEIAARTFDLTLAHGTTTTCAFATIHPTSVDAYFTEARKRNLRALTGKVCMDRNAPENLCDTPQSAYDDSKRLLEKWHGQGRLGYVITPRFTPTCSPGQLAALGALQAEYPDCLMQTHLSEQHDEIQWVRQLHPGARDYLDTYEAHGLLGPNSLFGHAVHLTNRERARLHEADAAVIHCPTSNSFIGSGLFDMHGLKPLARIGLATDTGGGSSFSMLRTMAAAYEIAQLRGHILHPADLWYLATAGSAAALRLSDKIGTIAAGIEADLTILNLASTPAIAQRAANAESFWESLFPTIMLGDDRAIEAVWVAGHPLPR